jgi:thiamine pyrophosphokinase
MNTCYIFGALQPSKNLMIDESDLIIAVDKGYSYLKCRNERIDLVVGDFDSLGYVPKDEEIVILPKEKDITDLHKAIEEGIKKGYKQFVILGCLGGEKEEHTIATLQDVYHFSRIGYKFTLYSLNRTYILLNNDSISLEGNSLISILSLSPISKGVTLKNLKYELNNKELSFDFPLGVSNEFIQNKKATIEVKDGCLLIIY